MRLPASTALFLAAILSCARASAAHGHASGMGSAEPAAAYVAVAGVVTDQSGAAVARADVTLRREAVGFVRTTRTGPDGHYRIEAPPAEYEISACADGFSVVRRRIVLAAGEPDVGLTLAPGVFTESVTVVGTRVAGGAETLERMPGSVDAVDTETLAASRVLNVNEALHKVSGVNVRDEEGFALRPNIGIRGLNPTRSSKVLLLEDGVFVTYAPYGDNATYYHPPIERFESIEVVKGAGQIAYGPVTVGGVVNYLTPAPPERPSAALRLSGGTREFFEGTGRAGGTWGPTALLGEYVRKQGDGARDNVHSRVDDASLKAVLTLGPRQSLTLKGSYYGEDSQVTYSGLRLDEWEAGPRANPFLNDAFSGWRAGASVKHGLVLGSTALLTTHVYGSRFSRDWWRQSSNSNQRPNDARDPACGGMDNLLTTCGNEGRLRDYDHAGIEPRLRAGGRILGARHELEIGARAHFERQERIQKNGDTPIARDGVVVEDNNRENQAYSAFVQDRVLLGSFALSGGVRVERIGYERTNRLANDGTGASGRADLTQWVPGAGVAWSPSLSLSLFAGIHRGFAPPRTEDVISQTGGVVDLEAEKSWNYEIGWRTLPARGVRFEGTLFRSDYENQIVPASLAGGVGAALTNGGATLHQGVEVSLRVDTATLFASDHDVYLRAAFTLLPTASFEGTRTSNVPGFGDVSVTGNRLPYAPERLLTAALGYRHPRGFLAQAEVVRVSEQFGDDLNSVAPTADGQRGVLPAYTVWNLALSWDVRRLSVFATAKNVLDSLYVADRSRGMIPGPPRLVQVGIAARF